MGNFVAYSYIEHSEKILDAMYVDIWIYTKCIL